MEKFGLLFSQDPSISIGERIATLRTYDIQYILIEDHSLKEYYANFPNFFTVQEINDFWMIKFRDSSS
jgi:hypothetical protein